MANTYVIVDTTPRTATGHWATKIGHSNAPENRIRTFQTGSSGKLALLCTIPGVQWEDLLHTMFAEFNLHGEWFELDMEQLLVLVAISEHHAKGSYDLKLLEHLVGCGIRVVNPTPLYYAIHQDGWDTGLSQAEHNLATIGRIK